MVNSLEASCRDMKKERWVSVTTRLRARRPRTSRPILSKTRFTFLVRPPVSRVVYDSIRDSLVLHAEHHDCTQTRRTGRTIPIRNRVRRPESRCSRTVSLTPHTLFSSDIVQLAKPMVVLFLTGMEFARKSGSTSIVVRVLAVARECFVVHRR